MNNYYRILSEDLVDYGYYYDPPENYRIYQIVFARNRSSAIYKAWRSDNPLCTQDFRDKPKFSCHKMDIKNDEEDFWEVYHAIPLSYIGEEDE